MSHEVRNIRGQKLPNGLTVITEQMPHIRSVSIGIWLRPVRAMRIPSGMASPISSNTWCSRAPSSRSAEDIARQVDSIGGNMDAFTAKECICFNIKVLDEHVPIALDVLSDLVLQSGVRRQ